jgi:HEAT repeat protein
MKAFGLSLCAGSAILLFAHLYYAPGTREALDWQINGCLSALSDPRAEIRALALNKLEQFIPLRGASSSTIARLVDAYSRRLADQTKQWNGAGSATAAIALGRLQAKHKASEIAQLLRHPSHYVRRDAAWALGIMQASTRACQRSHSTTKASK